MSTEDQTSADPGPDGLSAKLHSTTDASVWTDEFLNLFWVTRDDLGLSRDDAWGLMVGWFANAIEVGRSAGIQPPKPGHGDLAAADHALSQAIAHAAAVERVGPDSVAAEGMTSDGRMQLGRLQAAIAATCLQRAQLAMMADADQRAHEDRKAMIDLSTSVAATIDSDESFDNARETVDFLRAAAADSITDTDSTALGDAVAHIVRSHPEQLPHALILAILDLEYGTGEDRP